MLTVNNVSVRFGKRSLYEDVNIKFNKGCCYGIIGANGTGKSTFLKVLSGELEPSKGDVSKEKTERISVLMYHKTFDALQSSPDRRRYSPGVIPVFFRITSQK